MGENDKLVKQIQEQIALAGVQVKNRMKLVQAELLEELKDESDKGLDLH